MGDSGTQSPNFHISVTATLGNHTSQTKTFFRSVSTGLPQSYRNNPNIGDWGCNLHLAIVV